MKRLKSIGIVLALGMLCGAAGAQQENGYWYASSKTAKSITGDVQFSNDRITINFAHFPAAQIRSLTPAELNAMFDLPAGSGGSGNLYRVDIPAEKKFLHHNTLCGDEDAQWVVTYVNGGNLQVALFSGTSMPVFTTQAINNATNLCGAFSYVK